MPPKKIKFDMKKPAHRKIFFADQRSADPPSGGSPSASKWNPMWPPPPRQPPLAEAINEANRKFASNLFPKSTILYI